MDTGSHPKKPTLTLMLSKKFWPGVALKVLEAVSPCINEDMIGLPGSGSFQEKTPRL